ncbi:MAG: hypothetical protein ACYTBX_14960 [Planctomycetota bacterium]
MVRILFGIAILFSIASVVTAEESGSEIMDFWKCASPTNGFWRLNDKLAPSGIEIGIGLTTVYQVNIRGGTSTHIRRDRHVGRYDLELSADMEKLLGIEGGSLFIHGWGGWPDTEGIDALSVGGTFGTNALAVGNRSVDIMEIDVKLVLTSTYDNWPKI